MSEISIIVPVFKVEAILNYCIESLVKQTFRDIEILLVDDGSPDNSGVICNQWAEQDSRIRVIHQKNSGQCCARNAALDIATGRYIMFVDSDDCVDLTICEQLYALAEQYDADYTKCDALRFSDYDSIPGCPQDTGKVTVYNNEQAFQNFICAPFSYKKHFIPVVWATLFRRHLFETLRFPEGQIYEEGFVLPQIFMQANKLVHLDKSLYFYYVNPTGTMSSSLTDKGLKSLEDWKQIHFLVAERFPDLAAPSAKRWVDKYILTYEKILQSDSLDAERHYARQIEQEFSQYQKYLSPLVDKRTLNKIEAIAQGKKYYRKTIKTEKLKQKIYALGSLIRRKSV